MASVDPEILIIGSQDPEQAYTKLKNAESASMFFSDWSNFLRLVQFE